jgi:hypothetical protein
MMVRGTRVSPHHYTYPAKFPLTVFTEGKAHEKVRIIEASSLMMILSYHWASDHPPCVIDGFLTKQQRCQHRYMGFGRGDREGEKARERSV